MITYKYFNLRIILIVTLSVIAVIAAFLTVKKYIQKNKKVIENKVIRKILFAFSKLYDFLLKVPLVRTSITVLRHRLYMKYSFDELTLRLKTISIFIISLILTLILTIILILIYSKDTYMLFVVIISCIYINKLITDFLVGSDTKLLKYLVDYIDDIKHYYHQTNMILESIDKANDEAEYLMSLHGKRIHELILKQDPSATDEYFEKCPNKFFKFLLGISDLTREYGDKKELYVENLNYIRKSIVEEIKKREKLSYLLKALATISLTPMFYTKITQSFMNDNFSQTNFFYMSSKGLIAKILIVASCFLSYIILREFQNYDQIDLERNFKWEEYILKVPVIKKIIYKLEPTKDTNEYKKQVALIEESGSKISLDCLYVRRILFFILSFIVSIMLFAGLHKADIYNMMNNPGYGIENDYQTMIDDADTSYGNDNNYEKEKEEQYNNINRSILNNLSTTSSETDISNKLNRFNLTDEEKKDLTKSIYKKYVDLKSAKLKWYEALISFIIAIFALDIPIIKLKIKRLIRRDEISEETYQFQTIIIVLMNQENVSIQMILEWMYRFAFIHHNQILRCINNLQLGTEKALRAFSDEISYKPLKRIIENLIMADNISLNKAFDYLKSEREFLEDERKEAIEKNIHNKELFGQDLGFAPLYVFIIIFVLLPLVWASWIQLTNLVNNLS